MTLTPTLPMFAAGIIALVAVVTDVRTRRIPNWLTAGGILLGLFAHLLIGTVANGGPGAVSGLAAWFLGAGLGFVLLLPFYLIRIAGLGHVIGAGDVKLMTALGAILGPQAILFVALFGALAGAVQSIVLLAIHGRLFFLLQETLVLHTAPTLSGKKAPYAVAIAAGVLISMVLGAL
jgi:prepilin peptidase CpaA